MRERVRERERESLCVSVCNATQRKEMLDTVAKESHYIKQDFPGAKWPDSELPKKFLQIPESAEVCVCVWVCVCVCVCMRMAFVFVCV